MKTLTVPRTWPIKKKGQKFIVRPKPGKPFMTSIPLALIFKNMLKSCKTMKEVRTVLKDKEILVDGTRRTSPKYLVGLLDTFTIAVSKEFYRMIINSRGKLELIPIDKKESNLKISKVIGKTLLKKGKIQLNLSDSRNIITKKKAKVGDSLLIEVPNQKIKEVFKLEKGNTVFLTGGKHLGETGTITKVGDILTIKTKESEFEVPKKYVLVIGKNKPAIKVTK
jgi:small subunit ribosomal protein S4e